MYKLKILSGGNLNIINQWWKLQKGGNQIFKVQWEKQKGGGGGGGGEGGHNF